MLKALEAPKQLKAKSQNHPTDQQQQQQHYQPPPQRGIRPSERFLFIISLILTTKAQIFILIIMDGVAGTVVQLPPAPDSGAAATPNGSLHDSNGPRYNAASQPVSSKDDPNTHNMTSAKINERNAAREQRKRELLIEARKARIDWILGGIADDAEDLKEVLTGKKNPLRELKACSSGVVSSAPDVIEALFSSKLSEGDVNDTSSKIASHVKRVLDHEHLSWDNVSTLSNSLQNPKDKEGDDQTVIDTQSKNGHVIVLPPVPSTQSYNTFLQILCQPDAADVVFSMQKFCRTIEEAAKVILSVQEDEKQKETNEKIEKEKTMLQQSTSSSAENSSLKSKQTAGIQPVNHAQSLAKAVRGFIKTTLREMQSHDAFNIFLQHDEDGQENDVPNEELMACLETFVFTKCHNPIYRVLGAESEDSLPAHDHDLQSSLSSEPSLPSENTRNLDELEIELQGKMKLLQFVSPEHLEIQCLKMTPDDSIDLSNTIEHLQSMRRESSPRQKLRCILLAYRGVNASLNAVLNKQKRDTPSPSPPSADDVLPTLILAVLRAQPEKIIADLRFIEFFATVILLRGEAGYAYTNLCGAVQFLRKLDMDAHAAEVSLGEEGAHLAISPDVFRAGIEQSKQAMKQIEKNISKDEHQSLVANQSADNNSHVLGDNLSQNCCRISISGRDIRDARTNGETPDIEWALRKQTDMPLQNGKVERGSYNLAGNSNLPPDLPPHFNRSYSYLTTRPDDVRISDLPKLLNEYRMLVHATECLLNERSAWRESEKQRQMELVRATLEKDFNEVIGESLNFEGQESGDNET